MPRTFPTAWLLLLALQTSSAFAIEWNGAAGSFTDPSQWSPPAAPLSTDTPLFDNGGTATFDSDAASARVSVSGPAVTTFFLGVSQVDSAPSGIAHTYTLTDTTPAGLAATNATLTISGGNLLLPSAGIVVDNSSILLGPYANVSSNARTDINNASVFTVGSQAAFSSRNVWVGTAGTGTLMLSPFATMTVQQDLSLAPLPGTLAHVQVQHSSLTTNGTLYVGGSASGAGGTADLQVVAFGSQFGSTLSADHLVVYPGSRLLTNQCGNIFTNISDISGSVQLQSTIGSGGGLQGQTAINLLPGSFTSLSAHTFLASPTVTLSSGAILDVDGGLIDGALLNAGELHANAMQITHLNTNGCANFTQRSSAILAGTAGPTPLLTLTSGGATIDGTLRLAFSDPAAVHAGDAFPIISAAYITGSFSTIDLVGLTGFTPSFSDATGLLTLVNEGDVSSQPDPLPEPASLTLLGLSLSGLAWRFKRR